ncbi:splicing factor, suppressor of white-apricot homolog isoform X2 [Myripristis murdjan]|uniref:splicing factor, suppressor of white-apricot homolog isoform X2 n=1 Tax=Myripristis murdjan TaxID=586833 RepID=UPI00117606F7|nr:splicing factor, suppressor of white-apricot homolog isoform X2 [Myripristis murdjan]
MMHRRKCVENQRLRLLASATWRPVARRVLVFVDNTGDYWTFWATCDVFAQQKATKTYCRGSFTFLSQFGCADQGGMYRRGAGKREHNNKPVKKDVSDSDKYAELLVFGYACKLFRDDERALFHEHGKHLIPWMGDKNIMIDRYDGRGHLHDLSEYDSGSWNTSYKLSEEEARIEALCDEERYLAMHTDLLEEEARQEEEYKRLSEALADEGSYNAVAFRYSADYYDPSQPTEEEDANKEPEEAEPEDSEEPFVAPPGLTIPPDVELPATTKTHAIIERTANFVCQQGAQFEIVLKAKQAGNSQFDFLRFDHYLNPYYKHILRAMKEGRYNPSSTGKQEQSQESHSDDSDEDGDGNYLHPSLFAPKKSSRLEELMKPLQVMDPDHPLAALVRKAQQERNGTATVTAKSEEVADPATSSAPAQYTGDPVYYGYYMLPDGTFCLAPPPPGIDASSYYNSTPSAVMAPPTSSGALPVLGTAAPPPDTVAMATPATVVPSQVTISAASAPDTSSRPQAPVSTPAATAIIPPPPDIQPVIDKLAEYVARNGVRFETSVRAKNDPRFDFLQSWHQYNTYYEFKKNYFMQKEGSGLPETGRDDDDDDDDGKLQSDKAVKESKLTKTSFAPICFAIKAKENDMLPLEKNRVRLDDDSDEDKLLEEEGLEAVMGGADMIDKEPPPVPAPEEKRPSLSLEELEAKQAKQKLEDRLAAAAREKLAQASKESKEKQLQAERKRKAALFLQTLRNPLTGEPEAKRAELESSVQLEMQEALSVLSDAPPPQMSSAPPAYPQDQRPPVEDSGAYRSREAPSCSASSSSYTTSRGADRDRNKGRDKDKKKKKHKRRSRSRSRSKSRHALPSAYRRARRSRSRSRSPGRRDRRGPSSERRREDRDRERSRPSTSSGLSRGRSRSRSPPEKRKSSYSSSGNVHPAGSSLSPSSSSPSRAFSPSASPASSLTHSRGGSQEKDKAVSSSIVSSVQSKITQDLMARVRAMLATSKTFQPPTS